MTAKPTPEGIARPRQRVLILKPGYGETLDPDTSGVVSLGDILRTTVILHLFPPAEYEVTWVVDKAGVPLLHNNPYIDRLLVINPFTPHLLLSEWFDIVVNFEKEPGICAVADRVPAWRRYGFRLDPATHKAKAYDYSDEALSFTTDPSAKRQKRKSWSEVLYEMLGAEYTGQGQILGYQPTGKVMHDVGLNHLIGKKFPMKRWPIASWEQLHDRLAAAGQRVSWQQGTEDLEDYIDWINSCKVLVTNDSLGLHIGLALGKPIVALFGPTLASEVNGEGLVRITPPVHWECIPCMESRCSQPIPCMEHITVDTVHAAVAQLIARTGRLHD